MSTSGEIIDYLKKNFARDDHIACDIWSAEDVCSQAQIDGIVLTPEQVNLILDRLHDEIEPKIGLNWDVVRDTISEVVHS